MPVCEFCGKELAEGQTCDCTNTVAGTVETVKENVVQNAAETAGTVTGEAVNAAGTAESVQNTAETTAETVTGEVVQDAASGASGTSSGLKISTNKIVAIVAGIIGLVLVANGISYASNAAITKPVKSWFTAVNKIDGKILGKAIYDKKIVDDDFWDDIDDKYDSIEDSLDYYHENLEDEYGSNVKVTYKIKHKREIKRKDLRAMEDTYDDYYDMDVKIKKGYYITADVKIKGKEDSRKTSKIFYVYKIKGAGWKISPSEDAYIYI